MTKEFYKRIIDSGMEANQFILLSLISQGIDINDINSNSVNSIIYTLKRKGYIELDENQLKITDGGRNILISLGEAPQEKIEKPDFAVFCDKLHKKIEETLLHLRGTKQIRAKINRTTYSFLCNPMDLRKKLDKMCKLYRINDLQMIENTIMWYISECHKANNWFPLMEYYILKTKDGVQMSQLISDMTCIQPNEKQSFKEEIFIEDNSVNI